MSGAAPHTLGREDQLTEVQPPAFMVLCSHLRVQVFNLYRKPSWLDARPPSGDTRVRRRQ